MLDYAAATGVKAWGKGHDELMLLYNYIQYLSNADPDSDGFTNWEEYRGFQTVDLPWSDYHFSARPGGLIDSTVTELFVDDQTELLNWGVLSEARAHLKNI